MEKIYPVPRHLEEIYCVNQEKSTEYGLSGIVKCTCGCEEFKIKLFGEYYGEDKRVSVREYNEGFALVVKAVCKKCLREWLLFDLSKHGYDGFVCHDGVEVPETELLEEYMCDNCRENSFKIDMGIEVEDREQFIEEVVAEEPEAFCEDDYVDAFNWLDVSLTCSCCGKERGSWINIELS